MGEEVEDEGRKVLETLSQEAGEGAGRRESFAAQSRPNRESESDSWVDEREGYLLLG